jgi:hypothetical protein
MERVGTGGIDKITTTEVIMKQDIQFNALRILFYAFMAISFLVVIYGFATIDNKLQLLPGFMLWVLVSVAGIFDEDVGILGRRHRR